MLVALPLAALFARAAEPPPLPHMFTDALKLQPFVTGLHEPTTMAWLDTHTLLVLEKAAGAVRIVRDGQLLPAPALRLAVNFVGERGLLGVALHPHFAQNQFVYLFYTAAAGVRLDGRSERTGGQRVERYTWSHDTLTDPRLITQFPYLPRDRNGPEHDGGKIIFGPDGKLYGTVGDLLRRGLEQNETPDDGRPPASSGSSVIFRLNDDGTVPADNPWAAHADPAVRRWFAVGIRNSFGLAFDPVSGVLWDTENGELTFDEINRVPPKFNSGWTTICGPTWHPDNRGLRPDRLLCGTLLGAQYHDPVFSWYHCRGIACLAFLPTDRYGPEYKDTLVVGEVNGRWLFHFKLNARREAFDLHSPPLDKLVVEGDMPQDILQNSHEIMLATETGGIVDIQMGPDGLAYLVSHYNGCIYVLKTARR